MSASRLFLQERGFLFAIFLPPSWDGLLEKMTHKHSTIDENYGFWRQTRDPKEVGQILAEKYAELAWDKNTQRFSGGEFLDYEKGQDYYLKTEIAEYSQEKTPESVNDLSEEDVDDDISLEQAMREIEALRDIQPHAVITTNYDEFLERIFNDESFHKGESSEDEGEGERYEVVVGEEILKTQFRSLGEILKIHGSATDPESLILTSDDYANFNNRKRYLSSKMLTYFAEHPLLIVGYSASDPNVRKILSWVNNAPPNDRNIEEDIYFLKYEDDLESQEDFSTEKRIQLEDGSFMTVKRILARDFDWVFEAFASSEGFEADVRYLRKLVANMYEVVRKESPRAQVVDHQQLEDIATNEDELATVLGISSVGDSPGVQLNHPLSSNDLTDQLGIGGVPSLKSKVIRPIYDDEDINITAFNNRYHVAFFEENSSESRRYSEEAIDLFEKVMDGEDYDLRIPDSHIPDEDISSRGYEIE
ncbi:SIR2 family NAD-dependent protein deacylase [Haloterrigena salifodinae]|uniref:SIR2 family NAD-dependent protein deacylase n=1 Tax=Haloterrigena salifodinae TaxID=2675099 RepID=UPI001E57F470|nr:SIR2 family protein [Haloterrigena salifodinae]